MASTSGRSQLWRPGTARKARLVAGCNHSGSALRSRRTGPLAFVIPICWKIGGKRAPELSFFSPLANEAPPSDADAVYLPGGYPELHADQIAAADQFMFGMKNAAQDAVIYGECGGYMVLGDGLIDADGRRHAMTGLLPLQTSFATPKRTLGYRRAVAPEGPLKGHYTAHEFHYSSQIHGDGTPLFEVEDASGQSLGPAGIRRGRVMGSYLPPHRPRRPAAGRRPGPGVRARA